MKTLTHTISSLLFLAFFLMMGAWAEAQISNPYEIGNNNTTCSIKVEYEFYTTPPHPGSGCVVCPGSFGSITIPPSSKVNIPSPCNPVCNVVVRVVAVNGVLLSSTEQITVDFGNQTGSNNCSSCTPCNSYSMLWTIFNTKFL